MGNRDFYMVLALVVCGGAFMELNSIEISEDPQKLAGWLSSILKFG